MLGVKGIESSQTERASAMLCFPKKVGTLLYYVDYLRHNTVTIRDWHPLPRMDKYIESLEYAKLFSELDPNSSCWQIEVHKRDRKKKAYNSHHALYLLKRISFGLCNAPATFQHVVDVIRFPVKCQYAHVY